MLRKERQEIERIKLELRANGMDDYQIEKYLNEAGLYEQGHQLEMQFMSNEKLWATKVPIEIDENEMPISIRSDFTTRSKRRRKMFEHEE